MLSPVAGCRLRFDRNRLEHKISGVNLIVRMRIRHADDFTFVLENQYVIDFRQCTQFAVLLLPGGFPIAVSRTNPRPPPRYWI